MKQGLSKISFRLVIRLILGIGLAKFCLALTLFLSSWSTPLTAANAVPTSPSEAAVASGVAGGSHGRDKEPSCNPEVLEILKAEVRQWDKRHQQLEAREKDLSILKSEIDQRLEELKVLQSRLEGPVKKAKASYESRFQHLVGVYSSMEPGRAAALLNQLNDTTVAKIFEAMKSKKVARILALMEPEKAAKISNILSRRKLVD